MDINGLQNRWEQALGQQGGVADNYAQNVASGLSVGQQQIKRGVADAQRRMAAQAAATGNPGAQRAAAFGAGNMASAAIGQGAEMAAREQANAANMQLQAAQSQAQGYAGAADWQQSRDNAARDFVGGILGSAAGAAGGIGMMMSDENRKRAVEHLEAGDADKALAALKSKPSDTDARAERIADELDALGAETSRKMRYADIPLGQPSPVAAPRQPAYALGEPAPLNRTRVDGSRAYSPPPRDYAAPQAQAVPMPSAAPAPQRKPMPAPQTLVGGDWIGRGAIPTPDVDYGPLPEMQRRRNALQEAGTMTQEAQELTRRQGDWR